MTWSSDGTTYKSGDSTVVKVSDTEYKVNFTANVLPAGNITIKVAGLHDFNGQTVLTASKSVTVPSNALSTLSGSVVETSDKVLTLTFTQPLDTTTATTAGTYVLTSTATTPVVVAGVVPTLDSTKMIVTLTYPASIIPGAYTLAVSGLKDVIGNSVAVANQSINIASTTKVDLSTVSATESSTTKVIAVTYPVAMSVSGATSITNIANYQYAPDGSTWGNLPAGTSLSASADGKTVNITLPSSATVSSSSLIAIGNNTSTSMNLVADSFGNLQGQLPGDLAPASGTAIGAVGSQVAISADTASTFSTTKIVDAHTLKTLVVGSKIATLAPGDFQYTLDGGTTWTNVTTAALVTDATGQWVSATIPDTLSAANDVSKIKMRTIVAPTSKSALGTVITASTPSSVVASGTDPFKASIASATMIDATHVRVVFNGFINAATVGGAGTHIDNGLVITATDTASAVETITGYDSGPSATHMKAVVDTPNSIIITFASTAPIDLTKPVTVKTLDPDSTAVANYPLDGNGVALTGNTTGVVAAAVKLQASTAITGTAIPATLKAQISAGDTINLTFNKLVDPTTILAGWDGTTDSSARIKVGTNGLLTVYKSDGTTQYNFGQLPGFAVDKAKNMKGSIALTGTTYSILTITFSDESGNPVANNDLTAADGVVRYTPATTLATVAGNPIDTSVTSTVTALSNPLLISASMTTLNNTHKFGTTTGDAIILTYNEPVATSISSGAGSTSASDLASLDSHLVVVGGTYTTTVSGKTVTVTCVTPATTPLDNTTPLTTLVGAASSVITETVGSNNSAARNTALTLTNN